MNKNPREIGANNKDGQVEVVVKRSPKETLDMMVQEEPQVPENKEISLYSIMSTKCMESK